MSGLSSKYIADQVLKKLSREYDSLNKLNIMVLGKTGVGKSTLINSIFGGRVVAAGTGKPVTNNISKVEQEDMPLAVYDTPGLELTGKNDFDSLSKQLIKLIKDNYTDKSLRLNTTQLGTPGRSKPAFLCVGQALCKVYEIVNKGDKP